VLPRFLAKTLVINAGGGGDVAIPLLARELAPVFAALMLTARTGSAMATELGTMRVTEQIDALETMAVNARAVADAEAEATERPSALMALTVKVYVTPAIPE
jgi:hypothetical protein